MDRTKLRLYAVTDRAWAADGDSFFRQVAAAIAGGADIVQLREKHLDPQAFLTEAKRFVALCREQGALSIINDSAEIAAQAGADGVHVGQEDMAASNVRRRVGGRMMIGVSVHSVEEALEAVNSGADCLGVGAMFATATKADAPVLPLETLRDICRAVPVPVVAIGGIGKENMMRLAGSGVAGVALVSAIFAAEDIEKECRELRVRAEQMVNTP